MEPRVSVDFTSTAWTLCPEHGPCVHSMDPMQRGLAWTLTPNSRSMDSVTSNMVKPPKKPMAWSRAVKLSRAGWRAGGWWRRVAWAPVAHLHG